MNQHIRIKRIYAPAEPADGTRVLVDRIWPSGVCKADARLDAWMRDIAPSTELRRWFGHDPSRWQTFRERYRKELAAVPEALSELMRLCRAGPLTLLFAARNETHNHAVVLREVLAEELAEEWSERESSSPVCYGSEFPGYYDGDS